MMKSLASIALSLALATPAFAQEHPWQKISDPTVAQLAARFAAPPSEDASQFDWGFSDRLTRDDIAAVLDHAKSLGVQGAFVEPKGGGAPYLSPGYFDAVKVLVEEAKKRDMHLWFDDDGGYPSGFAGGKFTDDRPDLRMKTLTSKRVDVAAGQPLSYKLEPEAICVLAVNRDTGAAQVLDSSTGEVKWTVPAGNWEIAIPSWAYRSGPTRSANNPTGAKDGTHSLMDYLDPAADKLFAEWTFDAYKKVVGEEFGKTVLGFRGDEPSFGFNPWSPVLLDEFQKRKGYDLRPWLASVASINIGRGGRRGAPAQPAAVNLDEAHRAYADYCDVWSDLFGENFFGTEGKWCDANGIEMQMHIEHEEILPQLAISNGDFFKNLRAIQVPGVDTIWHQIWHDVDADFPKLASSSAHLSGRPRAMTEAFAAYDPVPDLKEAGWILNHLMALGINRIEFMGMSSAQRSRPFYREADFPVVSAHVNRACYVLGEGRPTARIGVYIPSSSFWFNDASANGPFLDIVHQLLQHQRDLDIVDDYSLAESFKFDGKTLVNASGQAYSAILVPPADAISKKALDKLQAFAKAGGKVVFFGAAPKLVVDKNFLTAKGPAEIGWATLAPKPEITPDVLASLPASDLAVDQAAPDLRYNHRRLKNGDAYFFFNQGDQPLSLKAELSSNEAAKEAQLWDTATGKIEPWKDANIGKGKTALPLELPAWGTKLVVIGG